MSETICYCPNRGDNCHATGAPGCVQGGGESLSEARKEAMDWLHGADRAGGLDGRFAGALGLVRALRAEADKRIADAWRAGYVSGFKRGGRAVAESVNGVLDGYDFAGNALAKAACEEYRDMIRSRLTAARTHPHHTNQAGDADE